MQLQNVLIDTKKVSFIDAGKGPVVVMLHGFMESSSIWTSFIQKWCNEFRVIAIDLPGHGATDIYKEIHSMSLMADLVHALLTSLNISSCVMIGHSMGGYVSLAFAEKYPDMLKGLCLFHSHSLDDSDEAKQNRIRTVDIIKNDKLSFVSSFTPSLFDSVNVVKFQQEINALMLIARHMQAEAIIAAQLGMKDRGSKEDVLRTLQVPVLSVLGKQDIRMPFEKLMVQASLPAKSEMIILDNCGHMGFIEHQDLLIRHLRCFICRCQ